MTTDTKYFGTIEYEKDELISFPKGLYGFEEEKEFLLLPFSGNGSLFSLQSIMTPLLAFVVMDPFMLDGKYAPMLQPEELQELGAADSQDLYYYVMCVVKDPASESTVNLKCPLAINGDTRKAMQVILEGGEYQMRHRLCDFATQGEAPLC